MVDRQDSGIRDNVRHALVSREFPKRRHNRHTPLCSRYVAQHLGEGVQAQHTLRGRERPNGLRRNHASRKVCLGHRQTSRKVSQERLALALGESFKRLRII
jgi:hypothetical protein